MDCELPLPEVVVSSNNEPLKERNVGENNGLLLEACSFESQGRFDLAAQKYRQALERGIGDQAVSYQGLGRALVRLGHLDEGVLACQEALKLNPALYLARGMLGYVYLLREEYELAAMELQAAACLQPDDPKVLFNLALAYRGQELYQEAAGVFAKRLALQPENWEIRIHLADMYLAQGYVRRAAAELWKTFRIEPTLLVRYPFAPWATIGTAGLKLMKQLNPLGRLGAAVGLMFIAGLAPTYISVPIGMLLSGFAVLLALTSLRVRKGKRREYLLTSLFLGIGSFCYWIFVLERAFTASP